MVCAAGCVGFKAIHPRPCTLNPTPTLVSVQAQHPRIEQMDFFDLQPEGCYDAVVLSMVWGLGFRVWGLGLRF